MPLKLKILTPEGVVVDREVDSFSATGLEGEFEILPGHIPFLSALRTGPASYLQGIDRYFLALGEGYAEVYRDEVTVFVDKAVKAEEIDFEKAKAEEEKAKSELAKKLPMDSPDFKKYQKLLRRAQTKLFVASKAGR